MDRKIRRQGLPPVRSFRLILTSDWHLRDDIPACRERDEYLEAQEWKLYFIKNICSTHNAILIHAGDLFDNWKPSPWLISLALKYLPKGTIVVPGQHDLPGHNLGELVKTGLKTLEEAGTVIILTGGRSTVLARSGDGFGAVYGYSYGEKAENPPKSHKPCLKVLVWHHLTCHAAQPWPGAEATNVSGMKKHFNGYDLVLTGDNHQQFAGDWLVNPGSLMRMTSDQVEFEPAVYGWSEDGRVTRIPLPIEKDVVKATSRPAKEKASRDERMTAYIKRSMKQYEDRLSFDKNLERHFNTNKEREGVKTTTWKAVNGEK